MDRLEDEEETAMPSATDGEPYGIIAVADSGNETPAKVISDLKHMAQGKQRLAI